MIVSLSGLALVLVMSSSRCLVQVEVFAVEHVAGLAEHSLRIHSVQESFFQCSHPEAHTGSLSVVPLYHTTERVVVPDLAGHGLE